MWRTSDRHVMRYIFLWITLHTTSDAKWNSRNRKRGRGERRKKNFSRISTFLIIYTELVRFALLGPQTDFSGEPKTVHVFEMFTTQHIKFRDFKFFLFCFSSLVLGILWISREVVTFPIVRRDFLQSRLRSPCVIPSPVSRWYQSGCWYDGVSQKHSRNWRQKREKNSFLPLLTSEKNNKLFQLLYH